MDAINHGLALVKNADTWQFLIAGVVILASVIAFLPGKMRLAARAYAQAVVGRAYLAIGSYVRLLLPRHARSPFPALHASQWTNMVEAEWLTKQLRKAGILKDGQSVSSAVTAIPADNRGLASVMLRVTATINDGSVQTYILKSTNDTLLKNMVNHILSTRYREAILYHELGPTPFTPKVLYAYVSQLSGSCVMLMEDLGPVTIGTNQLFGNQIWGVKPGTPDIPVSLALKTVFEAAAELHVKHWNDPQLFNKAWLKGADWQAGRGRTAWELAVHFAKKTWETYKSSEKFAEIKFSKKLADIIDYATNNSSWEDFQTHLHDPALPYTMIHGDFHASNMLWRLNDPKPVVLLDWSEPSICEPLVDLSQMVMSDVRPKDWRAYEEDALKAYYNIVIASGVSEKEFTFANCKEQYARGGVEKWLWLMCLLVGMQVPANLLQYFHDQILAFIEDHPVSSGRYTFRQVVTLLF